MPPPRSLRCPTAAAAPSCSKATDRRQQRKIRGGPTVYLSDDALAGIFAGLPDAADVVRCAATCRRWCRVVATSAAIISRSLPPLGRFLPDLAVGLVHQEKDWPTSRGRDAASSRPCFIATASAARFLGPGQQRLLSAAGLGESFGFMDYARPVASRNGRLVLELRREGCAADGLQLAACNPMIPDNIVLLPPLTSAGKTIREYGCALLTGHDLRPQHCGSFFRLLLVYNPNDRGGGNSTVLRIYSSHTGCWGPEAECSVKIPSSEIRDIGPAVVRRGVAFWALNHGVLGVRLDKIDDAAARDMNLVPYHKPHYWPNNRLLGVSSDNRLFYMYVGVLSGPNKIMLAKLVYFEFAEDDDMGTGRKCTMRDQESVLMHQMKMTHHHTEIKLRWFGEKSGVVLFTLGERSGHKGTFMLNLRDKVVDKVVADDGDSWRNLLGYEMDMEGYLASVGQQSFT